MRWREQAGAIAALLVASAGLPSSCAPWSPPPPPPAHPIPTPPALWPPDPRTGAAVADDASRLAAFDEVPPLDHTPDATTSAAVAASGAAPASPPDVMRDVELAPPQQTIELETPYKLGERVEPTDPKAWEADIYERRHWNSGGLGELSGELPGVEGHPDPRVIVNVDRVRGPHEAKDVQRLARKFHWINVVRCYRLGAYKDPHLRGWTKASLIVSRGGAVVRPRLLETELKDKAVAKCMVRKLRTLTFGRAGKSTTVFLDMRVGPGDDPMPPPKDEIVRGDGTLSLEAMARGVAAGLPAFRNCYQAALEYAPGLWGRLIVRYHVDEHGVLKGAFEAGARFPDARAQQCILRAARQLTFPKPEGGELRFVVPMRLHSDRSGHLRTD